MPPHGRQSRSRSDKTAGSPPRTAQRPGKAGSGSGSRILASTPVPQGHGPVRLLLTLLLIAGFGTMVLRFGPGLLPLFIGTEINAPPCSAAINRWANQRLVAARAELEQDHALYRSDGKELNAVSAALNWIDDRIIDQRIGELRRKLRASVFKSAGCVARFRG